MLRSTTPSFYKNFLYFILLNSLLASCGKKDKIERIDVQGAWILSSVSFLEPNEKNSLLLKPTSENLFRFENNNFYSSYPSPLFSSIQFKDVKFSWQLKGKIYNVNTVEEVIAKGSDISIIAEGYKSSGYSHLLQIENSEISLKKEFSYSYGSGIGLFAIKSITENSLTLVGSYGIIIEFKK